MIHKPSANQAPPQEHLQLDCPELMPTRSHRSHPSWPVASGLDEGRRTAFRIQVVKRVKLKFNYECFETQNRVRPRSMPRRQPPNLRRQDKRTTYVGRRESLRSEGETGARIIHRSERLHRNERAESSRPADPCGIPSTAKPR
jgi:hypothetical protein